MCPPSAEVSENFRNFRSVQLRAEFRHFQTWGKKDKILDKISENSLKQMIHCLQNNGLLLNLFY